MPAATDPSTALCGPRVRLRQWTDADLEPFAAMNADHEVMRHLIAPLSRAESDALAQRQRTRIATEGFGLWALEVPHVGFAGFVGLAAVPFELPVPGLAADPHEIGWRLARSAWGHGYATEAATLALRHGFAVLGLSQLVSFTAVVNTASRAVMQRIGLTWRAEFDHPRLDAGHRLRRHVLYAQDVIPQGARPS